MKETEITNELRELIMEFLNGTHTPEEMASTFDLKKCDKCEQYDLEENIEDTTDTLGIGDICPDCKNDL